MCFKVMLMFLQVNWLRAKRIILGTEKKPE